MITPGLQLLAHLAARSEPSPQWEIVREMENELHPHVIRSTLHALEIERLVDSTWQEISIGRPAWRAYWITTKGRVVLATLQPPHGATP